jgi:hypothetical protein
MLYIAPRPREYFSGDHVQNADLTALQLQEDLLCDVEPRPSGDVDQHARCQIGQAAVFRFFL